MVLLMGFWVFVVFLGEAYSLSPDSSVPEDF